MTRSLRIGGALALAGCLFLALGAGAEAEGKRGKGRKQFFRRLATFTVFSNTNEATETAAEIIAASTNGRTLIYTDSETNKVGFVDIADPSKPKADGTLGLDGEPTSVAVAGRHALVGVDLSDGDFVNTAGELVVVDIKKRTIVREIDLGGQPDSVAVSPNGRYAAVVIENERDEDNGPNDGRPPQLPAGFLVVVDLKGNPAQWTTKDVALTGLADADRFPDDPEPEYVDVNDNNIAAISLQENNHLVLVDLVDCEVIGDFSASDVDLDDIDTLDDKQVKLVNSLNGVRREPDAVHWIDDDCFATANEGDLDGGSRGFTIFDDEGGVLFDSGVAFEHLGVALGHYPDKRSDNKGVEPEGLEVGKFGPDKLLFVGSERGNYVGVFKVTGKKKKKVELLQTLPVTNGPEGLLAIPSRKLFVVASEVDDAGEGIRSTITIFKRDARTPFYPEIASDDDANGLPIPWGALSGLAGDPDDADTVYAVTDSFYVNCPRILEIDVSSKPARIVDEILVKNADGSIPNYDLEGIVKRKASNGGFWLASEGRQNNARLNLLVRVDDTGIVQQEVQLPAATQLLKTNNGFEGVALVNSGGTEVLYAAIQREWSGDPSGCIRVGKWISGQGWTFAYYRKDVPTSPNGGWVGLSEVVAVDADTLAFIERDNQRGTNARIKQITTVPLAGVTFVAEGGTFPKLRKKVVRDILPDLNATNGWTQDKPEGLAIGADGAVYLVTDNDGVDDATGETRFSPFGNLFDD